MDARTVIPQTAVATGQAQTAQRHSITFTVRGLEPKDERVFKSFIRLIAHRTQHVWVASDGAAEVCVAPNPALQEGARHLLLVVNEITREPVPQLSIPFHAADMESALDALGGRVLATRAAPATRGSLPRKFRLLRWPPAHLLKSSQRMRLATAISGKHMSVQELHIRTSVPHDACLAFAHDLQAHGLLAAVQDDPGFDETVPASLPVSVHSGLLARIRDRLSRIATT